MRPVRTSAPGALTHASHDKAATQPRSAHSANRCHSATTTGERSIDTMRHHGRRQDTWFLSNSDRPALWPAVAPPGYSIRHPCHLATNTPDVATTHTTTRAPTRSLQRQRQQLGHAAAGCPFTQPRFMYATDTTVPPAAFGRGHKVRSRQMYGSMSSAVRRIRFGTAQAGASSGSGIKKDAMTTAGSIDRRLDRPASTLPRFHSAPPRTPSIR